MEKKKTRQIETIILGGSFAGLSCLNRLNQHYRKAADEKVALVTVDRELAAHPLLVEIACHGTSTSPTPASIAQRGLIHAQVVALDLPRQTLTIEHFATGEQQQLCFKNLVLALNALPTPITTPQLQQRSFPLKTLEDAKHLYTALEARYAAATSEPDIDTRLRQLTFVISGGSDEAIHLAGNLLSRLKALTAENPEISKEDYHVFLIHNHDRLLPSRSAGLAKFVQTQLRNQGLKLCLERKIDAIELNRVRLDDGTYIESDTVILTAGCRPHPLLEDICQQAQRPLEGARIRTLGTLQVHANSTLWACGDCVAVPRESGGDYPNSALCGYRQGQRLAQNLIDASKGKHLHPFNSIGPGEFVPLGNGSAAIELFNLHYSSRLFGWLWRRIRTRNLPGPFPRLFD